MPAWAASPSRATGAGAGLTAFVAENGSIVPGVDAGREVRRIELRRRPGGGYDASGSVFATGFGEQDPLGTAIGPGGALYVTLFGTGAVVRFFPGYRPLSPCAICPKCSSPSAFAAIHGDMRENRKLNVDWPPVERMPAHIQDALHAGELHDRGEGPALNDEQVEALMDLTSWAFNGVAPDHPQFEVRLAAWTAQVARAPRPPRRLTDGSPRSARHGRIGTRPWPTARSRSSARRSTSVPGAGASTWARRPSATRGSRSA